MKHEMYRTEQEAFWAGTFGDQYIARNQDAQLLASNIAFFSRALARAAKIDSCLEVGANVGMNLRALKWLYPRQEQYAVEINHAAAAELRKWLPDTSVLEHSILDLDFPGATGDACCDLVFTKGVLIHINPDYLENVYDKLCSATRRYVLLCEYYNPVPVSVDYRGHAQRLYKRDFAGEMMERHPFLELLDYGFVYRRDRAFPQDDITWFLMEKKTVDAPR